MDQPTAMPTRKWATSVMAGAIASVVSWGLSEFAHTTLPPGIEGAFVVIISGLSAYFIPNADPASFEK